MDRVLLGLEMQSPILKFGVSSYIDIILYLDLRFVPGCSTTYLRSNDILTGTPIYSILSHGQTLAGIVTRQPYAMIIQNSKLVGV